MSTAKRIFRSSLGNKYLMAITGSLLFVFLLVHLAGNLRFFLGREAINSYGQFLHSGPVLVWTSRLGLLAVAAVHVSMAVKLSLENRRARPVPYQQYEAAAASYASRTMLMSGLVVATFVIYHLLHFTAQVPAVNLLGSSADLPGGDFVRLRDAALRPDLFRMLVLGFSNLWVSAFYLLGVGMVSIHLSHGLGSMFQSLGWKARPWGWWMDRTAQAVGLLVFLGYASIPVAVLLGYGKE